MNTLTRYNAVSCSDDATGVDELDALVCNVICIACNPDFVAKVAGFVTRLFS